MNANDTQPVDWRSELRAQGRSLTWLATVTGTKRRTVYGYSQRTRTAPNSWLAKVRLVLGRDIAA